MGPSEELLGVQRAMRMDVVAAPGEDVPLGVTALRRLSRAVVRAGDWLRDRRAPPVVRKGDLSTSPSPPPPPPSFPPGVVDRFPLPRGTKCIYHAPLLVPPSLLTPAGVVDGFPFLMHV